MSFTSRTPNPAGGAPADMPPARVRRICSLRRAALLAGAALPLLAAGCGFQPIHAERSRAGPAALAQVEIELIEDRTGQMLRNALLDRFRPRGGGGSRYSLNVELAETREDLGIRRDAVATRANLILVARYRVAPHGGGDPLISGSSRSISSYNILTSDFATLSARNDARERAVRQIADQIEERVAAWLLQTGGRAVPPPAGTPPTGTPGSGTPGSAPPGTAPPASIPQGNGTQGDGTR